MVATSGATRVMKHREGTTPGPFHISPFQQDPSVISHWHTVIKRPLQAPLHLNTQNHSQTVCRLLCCPRPCDFRSITRIEDPGIMVGSVRTPVHIRLPRVRSLFHNHSRRSPAPNHLTHLPRDTLTLWITTESTITDITQRTLVEPLAETLGHVPALDVLRSK